MSDTSTQSTDQAALAKAQSILSPGTAGPQSYGPGQNPFTAAANNVDVQKAAMLSAIANGGTAGRAALDQANAAIAAQRQGVIQAALAGSAVRGANPGMQASIASTVGSPGQQYGADLSAAGRSFTGATDALGRGYGQYADMAKQAVPVLQAKTDQLLAAKRADTMAKMASSFNSSVEKAAQAQQDAQQNQTLKGLEIDLAKSRLAGAGSGTGVTKAAGSAGLTADQVNAIQGYGGGAMWTDAVNTVRAGLSAGHDPTTVFQAAANALNAKYRQSGEDSSTGAPTEQAIMLAIQMGLETPGLLLSTGSRLPSSSSSASTNTVDAQGNTITKRTSSSSGKGR